jgi:hypothetical protein
MIDGAIFGGPRMSLFADPKDIEEFVWMTFAMGIDFYLAQAQRTVQGIEERSRIKLDVRPQTGTVVESKLTHAGGDTYAAMTINSSGKYQINFSSKLFDYPAIEVGDARPGVVGGMTLENYGENALYFGMETPSGYFLRKALKNPFGISVYDASPVTTTVPSRSASPLDLTTRPFDWMSPDRSLYTLYARSLHVAKMKGCRNSRSRLCSANDRFEVSVDWRDSQGRTGRGRAIQLTGDTGYFWFFDEKNIEMVVKVLDGCGVNQRYWVFAGGLTNVQADITVRDTFTGAVKSYRNPLNTPFQPVQDTGAFAGCSAGTSTPVNVEFYPAAPRFEIAQQGNCSPNATTLCLGGRRFRLQATYRTNDGKSGAATAVSLTDDSGYFWFFDRENVELIAKVLNGCGVNGRQWVFAGGLTNVEVELTVTDTVTGATKRYTNPQNRPFDPIQDTGAFASCQ